MVNYFSVGVDSHIGFGFDKNRTHNVCCNKCVYACEGIKKCCCHRNKTIKNIISHLSTEATTSVNLNLKFIIFIGTTKNNFCIKMRHRS